MSAPIRLSLPHTRRAPSRTIWRFQSTSASAEQPASPLLVKIRNDLKVALRAKDTTRLNVLRAILADVINASKTSSPVTSDIQLFALIRKRTSASREAASQFATAGRMDLVEKEEAQTRILDEYAGEVEAVGAEEMEKAIQEVVEQMKEQGKVVLGQVMKALIGEGGSLAGKSVDRKELAAAVKRAVG
ncbi:GatB/YqeY domain-containing protein [Eremomyces bilateralis CBS 781.70]|uniref:Altered inheritance of mitochondria protein 41 n=1 Tax=Eremomyces bilateralis CBS 781.70 TaxID=1392243 RepID=A0A6G1G664_9PEZI|nr:GatB/YqeY domain-containing protein [Eremomyces bilateralis CBS 781.70]KAF1813319.1 GatB/YqeY domain-containing protein [Eremomyces bilateralis CBS 781.70]